MLVVDGGESIRQRGQALVEYAVVLALVAAVVLAAVASVGSGVSGTLEDVSKAFGSLGCNAHAAEHCHNPHGAHGPPAGKGAGK